MPPATRSRRNVDQSLFVDGCMKPQKQKHCLSPSNKMSKWKKFEKFFMEIHNALHTPRRKQVIVHGSRYVLQNSKSSNSKMVNIPPFKFMTQDATKEDNKYSELVNEGHKITWVFINKSKWILIFDNKVLY